MAEACFEPMVVWDRRTDPRVVRPNVGGERV